MNLIRLLSLALLLTLPAARARTWFIVPGAPAGGDGTAWARALPDLDTALASARPGDGLWVRAGTLDLSNTVRLPAGVALIGGFAGDESSPEQRQAINFAHETTLRIRRPGVPVVALEAVHDVRLEGVTLTGAEGAPGLLLRRCGPSVVVTACRINRNTSPGPGAGLRIEDESRPVLRNVQLAENRATGAVGGGGLFIDATSGCDWIDGIINGNVAEGARGGGAIIASPPGSPALLVRCDFYFNESGESASALEVTGHLEFRDGVICSNLARTVAPGLPLAARGEAARVILAGQALVTGNVHGRDAPQYASALEGAARCELRGDALVAPRETGPADPALLSQRNDLHVILPDVIPPPLTAGAPSPGRWVKATLPSRAGTAAYHCIYLPADWRPGGSYPVLVGFPGNGPFRNRFGDRSGGMPEDNPMGIGLSGGRGFIVLGLGYLDSRKNLAPTGNWWGDVTATLDYTREAVGYVCAQFGGDPARVVLFGFSRSAIGASFLGLHDDTIAPLWRAFLCYDGWEAQADMTRDWYRHDRSSYHYDPADAGGTGVARRFQRLAGRPLFVVGGRGDVERLNAPYRWPVELMAKTHRNHNVSWTLRDTPERAAARAWLARVLAEPVR